MEEIQPYYMSVFISCILLWNRWLKCYLMGWVGQWVVDGLRFTVAHVSSSQLGVRFARIVHLNIYRFRAVCIPYNQGKSIKSTKKKKKNQLPKSHRFKDTSLHMLLFKHVSKRACMINTTYSVISQ